MTPGRPHGGVSGHSPVRSDRLDNWSTFITGEAATNQGVSHRAPALHPNWVMLVHCITGMLLKFESVTVLVTIEDVPRAGDGHERFASFPGRARWRESPKAQRASTLNAHRPVIRLNRCQVDAPLQWSEPRGGVTMRSSSPRVFVAAGSLATLLGVTLLATGGDARTTSAKPSATAPAFVPVCVQRTRRTREPRRPQHPAPQACARRQKPLKLALFPVPGAPACRRSPGTSRPGRPAWSLRSLWPLWSPCPRRRRFDCW